MTVQGLADDVLWMSAFVWVWLSAVYVFAERSRGWVRWGLVLTVVGVTQMLLRALITLRFGGEYPGRDWMLLTGRVEILVAGAILAVGLHRARWGTRRSRQAARMAAESPPGPREPSGYS